MRLFLKKVNKLYPRQTRDAFAWDDVCVGVGVGAEAGEGDSLLSCGLGGGGGGGSSFLAEATEVEEAAESLFEAMRSG